MILEILNQVIMFMKIIVVFLTLTWVVSSCSGSKDETIKTSPKIAQDSTHNNFLNTEIKSFDDLGKHLNDYKSIWKSTGIDWDYTNKVVINFKKWSDSGFLKTADDKLILQVINDLPTEGDLKGIVFDLWKESKNKNKLLC